MDSKVIAIDLDGTLLHVNSFHHWMIALFFRSLRHNLKESFALVFYVFLRLSKRITHAQMKQKILVRFNKPMYRDMAQEFAKKMHRYVSAEVLELSKEYDITILATAAPEVYAQEIAKLYGFDYVLATPTPVSDTFKENIRHFKANSVEQLLKTLHVEKLNAVVSDHYDDLALMQLADKVYLHNANRQTKAYVKANGVIFTII